MVLYQLDLFFTSYINLYSIYVMIEYWLRQLGIHQFHRSRHG